ncbi:hypothetical protein BLOT_012332 [Blomia tropicalis]|nr:hypothetical protein BLOT_012332 [Blomia tropicalis]
MNKLSIPLPSDFGTTNIGDPSISLMSKLMKLLDEGDEDKCCAVSVKLPTFIYKDPSLWIIQAEAQFQIGGIVNETTQYNHIISRLPEDVMIMCRDIVKVVPYKKGQLNLLKQALVKRYTLSAEKRVKDVLDNIQQLPGELPSIFFRRMIATADEHLPYDTVLQRFRERLPSHVAAAITPITAQINEKYLADKTRPVQDEITMLEVADLIPNSTVSPTFNSAIGHSPRHNRSTSRDLTRSYYGARSFFLSFLSFSLLRSDGIKQEIPLNQFGGQHKTQQVFELLEPFRIGNLCEEDHLKPNDIQVSDPSDEYISERNPVLITYDKPFNAETPFHLLMDGWLTLKYVNNHNQSIH